MTITSCLKGLPHEDIVGSNVPWFGDGHSKVIDKAYRASSNSGDLAPTITKEIANFLKFPVAAVVRPFDSDFPSPTMHFTSQGFEVIPHEVEIRPMAFEPSTERLGMSRRVHSVARTPPQTRDRGPQESSLSSPLSLPTLELRVCQASFGVGIMVLSDLLHLAPLTCKNLQ